MTLSEPMIRSGRVWPEAASLAVVLRRETAAIHREAERTGFVADLLRGRASRWGYRLYLHNFVPIYEALERQGLPRTRGAESVFASRELHRGAALRRDVTALAAPGDPSLVVLPEARAYAAAIIAEGDGAGWLGHAYARYLGDLSGGQILKALLARTLDLCPEQLSVYDFPGLPVAATKALLLGALVDEAGDGPDAARRVAAALASFRGTIALSDALPAVIHAAEDGAGTATRSAVPH